MYDRAIDMITARIFESEERIGMLYEKQAMESPKSEKFGLKDDLMFELGRAKGLKQALQDVRDAKNLFE